MLFLNEYKLENWQYSTLLVYILDSFEKNIHSKSNQISILKFLIHNGADINYKDFDGFTLLHDYFYKKDFYIFSLLLKMQDINIEKENDEGQTTLYFIFYHSDRFEMKDTTKYVRLLANYGAQFDISGYFINKRFLRNYDSRDDYTSECRS